MDVLLVGQPNVGKSVVFNRLTGANVTESNYPGTTVDYEKGTITINGRPATLIDVPGLFSLNPKDKAEEVAVDMLSEHHDAVVICVLDSTKIERGLYLALELIERGYRLIISLNMWDISQDKNIAIDSDKLQHLLGVPVIPTIAIDGHGMKSIKDAIPKAKPAHIEKIMTSLKGGKN